MPRRSIFCLAALVALLPAAAANAQYTTTSVVRLGTVDPDGDILTRKFKYPASVNGDGDVVLIGTPYGSADKIYLYPATGSASVVATGGTATPTAGLEFRSRPFRDASVNGDGEIAFRAEYQGDSRGIGIFVRNTSGALSTIARQGALAPGGGTYGTITALAPVTEDGTIAYLSKVVGGDDGVFSYNIPGGGSASRVFGYGDATDSGAIICRVRSMDVSDNDNFAAIVGTKADCLNPIEAEVMMVVHVSGGTITEVAVKDDPSPVASTTYGQFKLTPSCNDSGEVLFEAKLKGAQSGQAVFRWDGISSTLVVAKGDTSPEAGGTYLKISDIALATDSSSLLMAKFKGEGAKDGIIKIDSVGGSGAVLLRNDPPPDPPFATGSLYRKYDREFGSSADGGDAVIAAKILDTVAPKSQSSLIRASE
jgi:hypothetical protein